MEAGKNIIYTLAKTLMVISMFFFAACSDEEPVSPNALAWPTMPGLYINLTVGGEKASYPSTAQTRAAYTQDGEEMENYREGEASLDENTVYNVDFFLFDTEGNLIKHVSQATASTTGPTTDTNHEGLTGNYYHSDYHTLLVGSDWKNSGGNITGVATGYTLYALVNVDWEKASVQADGINDLTALKTLTCSDEGIYLKKQSDGAKKPFLMDGSLEFTEEVIRSFDANGVNQVTVDVKRAAAKLRVNIYKSDANQWAGYAAEIGTITGSLSNYASVTRASREGETLGKDARGLKSVSHTNGQITSYDAFDGETSPTDYVGSVLFYTFANQWEENSSAETWLELNIPYDNSDDGDTYTRRYNYYKIVFLPNDGKQLKRNTFYEVDIHVKNDGAPVSEEPEEIADAEWTISEWTTKDVTVVKNPTVDYLILSDYILDVRDEDHATITFYSSNYVNVEVIDLYKEKTAGKVSLADIKGTEIEEFIPRYLGRTLSTEEIAVPGVYYVNKENRRIDIRNDKKAGNKIVSVTPYSAEGQVPSPTNEEVLISWPNDQTKEGPINIYSKIPQNVTKRYITLRVTMPKSDGSGNLVKYAVVEQYPLEYVIIQEGLYSYADGDVLYGGNLLNKIEYVYGFPGDKKAASWFENKFQEWVTIPDSILKGEFHNGINHPGLGEKWQDPEKENQEFSGRNPRSPSMKSKFFLSDKTWEDAEGIHEGVIYQVDDTYNSKETENKDKDGVVGLVPNTPANNNSMYEVTISATSTKYTLSYPTIRTDEKGRTYAEESEANNNLLSPHFVLASQLGNNSATAYWESAQDLCKHYVEVSRDGKLYDNWRLPTLSELQIVKSYQQSEHVYDITMNKVLNADGDTDPQYWTAGKYWYVNTTGAGTGEKQRFTEFKYENPIPTFLEAEDWKMEFDWGVSPSNADAGYFSIKNNSDANIFKIDIPNYSYSTISNLVDSEENAINFDNALTMSTYNGTDNNNFYHFVLKGNKTDDQVLLSIIKEDGTIILSEKKVSSFMNAAKFSFSLGRAVANLALDNITLFVSDKEVYKINFENEKTYSSKWSFSVGGIAVSQKARTDGSLYMFFHQDGGSGDRYGLLKIADLESLYPSTSETEYFHINGLNGFPQKVLLPLATDIGYYQDEDEDGVADTDSKGKKIKVIPDANGVVNKRVLMETYTAGGTEVTQRKILSDKGDSEDVGRLDFAKRIRVRCVRDMKISDTK